MLLFHEVCHSSKIYLLIDGLKLKCYKLVSMPSRTVPKDKVEYSYKQCCLFSDPVICLYIIVLLVHALYS